jgi:phage protein D
MASSKSPDDSLQTVISFEVKVGGSALPTGMVVLKLHVKLEVNKIARAYISILGGKSYENLFPESENAIFAPGKDVEISLGYAQKNVKVFSGIITKHSLDISTNYLSFSSRNLLLLEASDKSIKMTVGKKSEIYEKKKDSDIITTLLSTAGLTKTVTATTLTHELISRHNCSDWEFMLNRAKANGMIVLNAMGAVTVLAPKSSGTDVLKVTYGKDIKTFRADLDASSQLQGVEAINYDIYSELEVKQTGADSSFNIPGSITGSELGKVAAATKISLNVPVPVLTQELKGHADALLAASRLRRMSGEMSFRGTTDVKLGCYVTLAGFGKLFNGLVYITGVEHLVENGQFVTKASFGLKPEIFSASLHPELNLLPPIAGLHVGIVKKLDADPDKKNRIQVMIPSLKSTGSGIWAMLGHFHAGKNSGSFFVPELNSEVIVGFINDDPRFPVVLGSLYSKNNTTQEKFTKDNFIKSIVTKAGTRLEFEDKDKTFKVITPGKNMIFISDKDKGVKIEDQNGNKIITSATGISIDSKKDIKITAAGKLELNGTKGVTVKSSSGDTEVSGKNAKLKGSAKVEVNGSAGTDIKSSAAINIKGSMVNVN